MHCRHISLSNIPTLLASPFRLALFMKIDLHLPPTHNSDHFLSRAARSFARCCSDCSSTAWACPLMKPCISSTCTLRSKEWERGQMTVKAMESHIQFPKAMERSHYSPVTCWDMNHSSSYDVLAVHIILLGWTNTELLPATHIKRLWNGA